MCIKFLISTDYGFQTDDNEMQDYTGENEQEFDNTQGPVEPLYQPCLMTLRHGKVV